MQVTLRNLFPPLRQGDQGSYIQIVLKVDDCDSQRWARGDWEVGILWMRIGTHQHTPLRQGDRGFCIQLLFGVDNCDSQRWAGGDWGVGI